MFRQEIKQTSSSARNAYTQYRDGKTTLQNFVQDLQFHYNLPVTRSLYEILELLDENLSAKRESFSIYLECVYGNNEKCLIEIFQKEGLLSIVKDDLISKSAKDAYEDFKNGLITLLELIQHLEFYLGVKITKSYEDCQKCVIMANLSSRNSSYRDYLLFMYSNQQDEFSKIIKKEGLD